MEMTWDEAAELVRTVRAEVAANVDGEFPLTSRNKLLAAMGDEKFDPSTTPPNQAIITRGLLRRLRLGELCFARVYPIWEELINITDVLGLIDATHAYIDRKATWMETWRICNKFYPCLDHTYEMPQDKQYAAYAGYCATGVLDTALRDDWHITFKPDEERDAGWDPFLCADAAYAHGRPPEDLYDVERSRQFWLWMLDQALPVAWNTPDRWW